LKNILSTFSKNKTFQEISYISQCTFRVHLNWFFKVGKEQGKKTGSINWKLQTKKVWRYLQKYPVFIECCLIMVFCNLWCHFSLSTFSLIWIDFFVFQILKKNEKIWNKMSRRYKDSKYWMLKYGIGAFCTYLIKILLLRLFLLC